jgi:hypothetical protein
MVNRSKSRVRARVEHAFAVVKRLWRFDKLRYWGLAKSATRSLVVLGLTNVFLAKKVLCGHVPNEGRQAGKKARRRSRVGANGEADRTRIAIATPIRRQIRPAA